MAASSFDYVIRNGLVFDGSGGEPFLADVAITGAKVVQVGKVSGRGEEEIDASGRIVTPGFVDIHTHYDGQVTWENRLSPSSYHGVTTVLMGNCGVGFAPCKPEHRDMLVRVMEGVEDIPEIVMTEGLPWNWETFPEYMDALEERRADMDFAAQLAHAPVRVNVMGQRGADREPPTAEEMDKMTAMVAEAIRVGAIGVTTSRSMSHRTKAGDLAPTVETEDEELLALARGLREAGAGVFQMIPASTAGGDPVAEVAFMRKLVETSGGRPLSYTLLNNTFMPDSHLQFLEKMEEASADGLPIRGQVFPRPVGVLLGLDLSFHPFRFNPSYLATEHLPLAERVAAMRDPAMRAKLLAEEPEHSNEIFLYFASQIETLYPLGNPPNNEPEPSHRVGEQAKRLGISAKELVYDLLLEDEGRSTLFLPAANFLGDSLEPVRELLEHPDTLIGLGDGGAHYGMICDSSYPTSLLAYWTRDRERGPKLPLPWAINALTRRNALAIGLEDRGLIAPGMKADLNVIDYERLQLKAPSVTYDLPAGGRRLAQKADGYDLTMVSGEVTYRKGEATDALPGRLVRNPATRASRQA
ncbi:amidohydrolase family protein [Parahaliea sp. F7430]|uniref:Amidohydrolase family protein n=1 Tax=Sediminihaliea albiluteola TaxID=2758564 RepID=A0A7W2TXE7_9GAMM|nr:amidohydrolase family protein [Sediminihaliea albiluteola]MBA6413681.1 amidohydrolase family protein [Sediminihaliea albiluteola]